MWWPKGFLTVVVLVNMTILSYVAGKSIWFPLLALFLFGVSLYKFLFPTTYAFYPEYIEKSQLGLTLKIPLKKFKQVKLLSEGILLLDVDRKQAEFLYVFEEKSKQILSDFFKSIYERERENEES
ncbi:MAG: hypothetical protein HQK50_07655 [Oligoflexia bacterium]|nr:hypothetical protein [Oligoflexia bacterium]